jgi:hypothetical protein
MQQRTHATRGFGCIESAHPDVAIVAMNRLEAIATRMFSIAVHIGGGSYE